MSSKWGPSSRAVRSFVQEDRERPSRRGNAPAHLAEPSLRRVARLSCDLRRGVHAGDVKVGLNAVRYSLPDVVQF